MVLNTFIRKDVNIGSTYKYSIIIQDLTKNYVKTGICHPPVNKNHSVRVMGYVPMISGPPRL
jgi:hypothetical protein